jgi:hypothetical protein
MKKIIVNQKELMDAIATLNSSEIVVEQKSENVQLYGNGNQITV